MNIIQLHDTIFRYRTHDIQMPQYRDAVIGEHIIAIKNRPPLWSFNHRANNYVAAEKITHDLSRILKQFFVILPDRLNIDFILAGY